MEKQSRLDSEPGKTKHIHFESNKWMEPDY